MVWFAVILFALAGAAGQTTPTPVPPQSPSTASPSATATDSTPPAAKSAETSPTPTPMPLRTKKSTKKPVVKDPNQIFWGLLAGANFGTFSEGAVKQPAGFEAHRGSVYGAQLTATRSQKSYVLDLPWFRSLTS
jgi:hypothetical protein